MVGQAASLEAGEAAKGPIESGDQRSSYRAAIPPGWHGEFRNNPDSVFDACTLQMRCKVPHLVYGQAIEKEVRHDEVIVTTDRFESTSICKVHAQASAIGAGATLKFCKHCCAGIDGINSNAPILSEQARGKSAVAVADNECVSTAL